MAPNKKRIIDISYDMGLSHIGSCLVALPAIEEIYEKKKLQEKFVLSNGHAHLAHAVVMESKGLIFSAKDNIRVHGIHCERAGGCDVSTGSLGQGLPIAVGMALADRSRTVYCAISDGEMAEGSIYEALRVIESEKIDNLEIHICANGYGAYRDIGRSEIAKMMSLFPNRTKLHEVNDSLGTVAKGLDAHYKVLDSADYEFLTNKES